jgi:hypothetical protein
VGAIFPQLGCFPWRLRLQKLKILTLDPITLNQPLDPITLILLISGSKVRVLVRPPIKPLKFQQEILAARFFKRSQ